MTTPTHDLVVLHLFHFKVHLNKNKKIKNPRRTRAFITDEEVPVQHLQNAVTVLN